MEAYNAHIFSFFFFHFFLSLYFESVLTNFGAVKNNLIEKVFLNVFIYFERSMFHEKKN